MILQEEKAKSGFSFVPTGPGKGSGSGVFFIDFSDDYKRCLKLARDKVEKEENLSKLEKEEMNWIKSLKESREKSLNEKMIQLKVSLFKDSYSYRNFLEGRLNELKPLVSFNKYWTVSCMIVFLIKNRIKIKH